MKKIMFMIPNLGGGGAEKVLVDIINHLDPLKFETTLILLQHEGIYLKSVAPHINVIALRKSHRLLNWIQSRVIKYAPAFYYERKINAKYDVEVAFLEGMATRLIAHSNNHRSKKIAWVHTNMQHNHWTKNMFLPGAEKKTYEAFHELIFVSKQAQAGFKECFKGVNVNQRIIFNPLFQEVVRQKATEFKVEAGLRPTVVAVGRLNKQKGFDLLIKAHAQRLKQAPHDLLIIGEGGEREALTKLIKSLQVSDSVKLLGFVPNPYPYMAGADLVVSSSRIEGYPMVLLEALALHKPILATQITGNNEILNEGEFAAMCEGTVESLAASLENLLTNPKTLAYYAQQSEVRAAQLRAEAIMKQIEQLLKENRKNTRTK
ncbi:MAG TPA: hypothetical protein DCY20_06695 [Firmicutes bacterium]|nr:hypothetical protein [Bacillota bacterium]